ncbi:MAG: hypothetical protein ABRQ39_17080 [Candidatus Eremiobacterota bacterium]
MSRIKNIYGIIIFSILFSIFIINILSVFVPATGKIGTCLWFFSYIFFIICALISLYNLIKEALTEKLCITLVVLLIWLFIIGANINRIKNVSGESTQQIAHTISLLHHSRDMAFNERCFLGYPARQFFLPSLPTLIMGRSVLSVNLGGSLYVLTGLLIFSRAISRNFENRRYGDLAGGIILSLIFHIYYVNFQIFWFEQSVYPFGFTLIICGLYLYYIKDQSLTNLSLAGLAVLYLIYSYTPSLSMACLSVTVLIYYYIKNFKHQDKKRHITMAMIIIFCIISFFLSFKYRSDVHLTCKNPDQPTNEATNKIHLRDEVNNTVGKIKELFSINTGLLVSPVSFFIFSMILICSIFLVFRWTMFFLILWITGTVIISVSSSGFAVPPPCFAIHRAIIIYPVMFIMFIDIIKSINIDFKRKYYGGIIILLFLLTTGIIYQQSYMKTKTIATGRVQQYILIRWLKKEIPVEDNDKIKIFYFDEALKEDPYISIYDMMVYFTPKYNISFPDSKIDLSNQLISSENNFLLVPPDKLKNKCYNNIKNRLKYINSFCGVQAINLYKIE